MSAQLIIDFVSAHKVPLTMLISHASLATGWFIHVQFPRFQDYCESRTGGLLPGLFQRLFGQPKPSPPAPAAGAESTKQPGQ